MHHRQAGAAYPCAKRGVGVLALVALLVAASSGIAAAAPKADSAVEFWTHARVAKAQPRDFVYDPASRRFVPSENAKPAGPGGGGGSTTVTGASWNSGGKVKATTGKVLFAMGSSYYVCSASTAGPADDGASVVLTAAHCVYDNDPGGGFATNWVFIPDYDAQPAPLSTSSSSYCNDTKYGCWSAAAMKVHTTFMNAGGFNSTAIPFDFAFVRLNAGGKANAEADSVVGAQDIAFTTVTGQHAYAFGYPASGRYRGNDLVYCAGILGTDPSQSNRTYRLGCDMTGGSSGGPWLTGFANGAGTLSSVNSYGYSGVKNMYGPKLNSDANTLYLAAHS
jgi:hypothetical protein